MKGTTRLPKTRLMKKLTSKKKAALDYEILHRICDRAFFMALKMIDIANSRPVSDKGEPKVGGHASACASSQHILAAIHLVLRNPEDYLACKPHVSPMDHAFNYLLHNFRDKDGNLLDGDTRKLAMSHLRHYSKEGFPVFQSYHAESDPDSFRVFPSGSVGIPPVVALYTALTYEFAKDHHFEIDESPYFWCLMGDSEFREGSLMEAMPDAGERELGRVVWIVDYNRQNLDGTRVCNEKALGGSDADRMIGIAKSNGWEGIKLKHGKIRERLFAETGGQEFRRVLDEEFTDFEFQAVLEANRPELTREVLAKKSQNLKSFLKNLSEEQIQRAFLNLGGHDIESLVETLQTAKADVKRPSLIVAYTVKGYGLRCQGLSGNHSTLPEEEELMEMAERLAASNSDPFSEFPEDSTEEKYLDKRRTFLVEGMEQIRNQVTARQQSWKKSAAEIHWPSDMEISALKFNPYAHTQWMWGQIAAKLDRLARGEKASRESHPKAPDVSKLSITDQTWFKVARYFLTMAPDVGTSTNTSPNMNGKLYGDIEQEDFELLYDAKDKKAPDVVPKLSERSGHLRFEIAEGNCMSAAGAIGKFFYFVGMPLFPAMTIYDFFIKRAHDQYYYNLYWRSSFATLGTPSGVTLAPEGAQHSWKSDFQIPHAITWEPCFSKELDWIFADILRRHFTLDNEDRESPLIRCVTKGLPQKEFLERLKKQKRFEAAGEDEILGRVREEVLAGAYRLIHFEGYVDYVPGDNVVHLFAMGAPGVEAMRASDRLLEKGIYANVFIVTSPDLCLGNLAYQDAYRHLRETLKISGDVHLQKVDSQAQWISLQGGRIPIVSVHDGEPGLLDNIGSIVGVKQAALAVRRTSKSGTTADIYHVHGIDADSIVEASEKILEDTAKERFEVSANLQTS